MYTLKVNERSGNLQIRYEGPAAAMTLGPAGVHSRKYYLPAHYESTDARPEDPSNRPSENARIAGWKFTNHNLQNLPAYTLTRPESSVPAKYMQ
jgi:hypothetical protein